MRHISFTVVFFLFVNICFYISKSEAFAIQNKAMIMKKYRLSNMKIYSGNDKNTDESIISSLPPVEETPEEKYKREKLAEIDALKAQEVFVTRSTGKYECQACGYIYDEAGGMINKGIAPGTPFDEIEKFRCPQCGANKKYFVAEMETLSGFKENLKFGLGGNSLTGNQKGNLIYGGLALGFALFMSGYLLE